MRDPEIPIYLTRSDLMAAAVSLALNPNPTEAEQKVLTKLTDALLPFTDYAPRLTGQLREVDH